MGSSYVPLDGWIYPALQRLGLGFLRQAAIAGEVPAWQLAYLEDRIAFFEGRPQVYGTQFDWDEQGQLSPLPIKDEANVDERCGHSRKTQAGPARSL